MATPVDKMLCKRQILQMATRRAAYMVMTVTMRVVMRRNAIGRPNTIHDAVLQLLHAKLVGHAVG
jgi:hypothetical protein